MAVVGSAEVLIRPAFSGLQSSISKGIDKPMAAAGDKAGRTTSSRIGAALKKGTIAVGLAVGAGLAYSLNKGLQRLTAIENAQAKLRGLGHDAESVQKIMDNALQAVKGTAFGLDEAASTAAGLVAAGVKPGKELEAILRLVGDSATIAGVSFTDMGAIWGKVAATGKLQGDEMNQLMEAGIPILQLLSKHYGKSAEDVRKMVSEGKVQFSDFAAAMEDGMGGAALESGKTFTGAMANLKASIGRIGANLLSGIFPKFAGGLTSMTEALAPLEDRAKLVGAAVGTVLTQGFQKAQAIFEKIKPTLITFGDTMADVLSKIDWKAILDNIAFGAKLMGAALGAAGLVIMKLLPPITTLVGKLMASRVAIIAIVSAFALWKTISAVTGIIAGVRAALALQTSTTVAAGIATKAYTVVMKAQVIWYKAWTVGMKVAAVASKIFTAGQWLMNAALSANPIGLVIAAIAALVAGFVIAYKKSATFRKIVDGALRGIAKAGQWMWNKVLKPIFTFMKVYFQTLGKIGLWLYRNAIKPAFNGIANAFRAVGRVFRTIWKGWLQPVVQLFGAIIKWLWNKAIKVATNAIMKAWNALGTAVRWVYRNLIKPVIEGYAIIGKWLWNKVLKPVFRGIRTGFEALGKAIRWVYRQIIKPIFDTFAKAARILREGLGIVWGKIKGGFKTMSSGMKSTLDGPLKKVFGGFKAAGSGMRDAFRGVVDKIGKYWESLQGLAKKPIKFIIETVINKGLIGGFNKLADFFKTKHMKTIPLPFARGGILPGRSSWRNGDDQLVTARRGEGWTVSEAMDPYERARLLALNKAALRGESAQRFRDRFEGFKTGGLVGGSGRFSALAEKMLLRAQELAGQNFSIFQRGFRPATSYSGTSHQGDAIDTGPVNNRIVEALRSVGWAAWDRTGKGNWAPHIHAVPLPGAGYGAGSAIWQAQDYLKGGDGLGGRDNGPRAMISKAWKWLKGKGAAIADLAGGFIDMINPKTIIDTALKKAMGLAKGVLDSPLGQMAAKAPAKIASMIIEWGKDKLAKLFPGGGPVSNAQWTGKQVGNWAKDQLNNAATIMGVARQLGFGGRGAQIALMTAMQESTLRNINYGDRDSLGLFQQRAPWGSRGDRTNPAEATRMFFEGGKGGQPGLRSKPWRTMGLGEAAQAVQVSAFPSAYSKWSDEAKALIDQYGHFDGGGILRPGRTFAYNGTRSNEAVLTANQWDMIKTLISQQGQFTGPVEIAGRVDFGDGLIGIMRGELIKEVRKAGMHV